MFTYMHADMSVCIVVCMYVWKYVCMCTFMYVKNKDEIYFPEPDFKDSDTFPHVKSWVHSVYKNLCVYSYIIMFIPAFILF